MNTFSTWLTVVILGIFVIMVGIATTYPPGARFMPFVVGFPGILLCLLQLLQDYLTSHKSRLAAQFHSAPRAGDHKLNEYGVADVAVVENELPEFGLHTVRDELRIWAYFVAFIAGVLVFGFLIAIPVLVTVYLWRDAEVRLPFAAIAGGVTVMVIYLMFEVLLRFQLHSGFITDSVLKTLYPTL